MSIMLTRPATDLHVIVSYSAGNYTVQVVSVDDGLDWRVLTSSGREVQRETDYAADLFPKKPREIGQAMLQAILADRGTKPDLLEACLFLRKQAREHDTVDGPDLEEFLQADAAIQKATKP